MKLSDEIDCLRRELFADVERIEQKRVRLAVLSGEGFGADGVRDPSAICTAFVNGPIGPHGDCQTDGHYLCDECVHRATCEGGCGRRPAQCECPTIDLDWNIGGWIECRGGRFDRGCKGPDCLTCRGLHLAPVRS